MKNWKTTVCGAVAAVAIALQAYDWNSLNWKTLAIVIATAAWGFFSKDSNVTGGTTQQ